MRFLRNSVFLVACLALAVWLSRAAGDPALYPPAADEGAVQISVVDFGWHVGLILPTAELHRVGMEMQDSAPDQAIVLLDLARQIGQADWLEIGWGDEAFYRAGVTGVLDLPIWTGAKALFGSGATVMHIFPGQGAPSLSFPESEVLHLRVGKEGFLRLAVSFADRFARAENGTISDIGPGLYGGARFYAANGRYAVTQTCNTWVSQLLRTAGVPSSGVFSIFSKGLMMELRTRTTPN
jgi:uncharacterized protein (TIGR02117 family)